MPRDWNGSVFKTPGRETWSAKWKEFGYAGGEWRVRRGFATKTEANDFLADKRREYRARRRGDWDEFTVPKRQPIAQHVGDFHAHILANRRRRDGARSEKHADLTRSRIERAFKELKVRCLGDLVGARVDQWLGKLLDGGAAMKTRNDYCAVLRQFTRWAIGAERLARDPLANIRFLDGTAAMARKQTLTWDRVRDLAAAGLQRLLQKARPGTRKIQEENTRRRSLAIITMFLTGLRNNELAHLQWGWIDHGEQFMTIPHQVTKSGRTEFLPLHLGLGQLLEQERARRAQLDGAPVPASALVVGVEVKGVPQLPRWIVDRMRDDAAWIGIPAVDERGRRLVLYSMRTSFATELDRLGVPDSVVAALMRHRAATVTLEHYVQRGNAMMLDAINKIPAEAAYVPGLFNLVPREAPDSGASRSDGFGQTQKARTS